jgi:RNA polymerase sigma-70 factor, ECF subfamily
MVLSELVRRMELSLRQMLGTKSERLAAEVEEQNRAAFAQWALPHKDAVFTACLYLTRDRDEAEDLLQETYLRAFRFFHHFTPGTNCRGWLLTIMHNQFKTRYVRTRNARHTVEFETAAYEYEKKRIADGEAQKNDPAELVLSHLMDSEIADAVQVLPEEYRTALILVDIEELSYDEAARVLECPIGTVRSRLSRARHRLRRVLAEYAREHGYLRSTTANTQWLPNRRQDPDDEL